MMRFNTILAATIAAGIAATPLSGACAAQNSVTRASAQDYNGGHAAQSYTPHNYAPQSYAPQSYTPQNYRPSGQWSGQSQNYTPPQRYNAPPQSGNYGYQR